MKIKKFELRLRAAVSSFGESFFVFFKSNFFRDITSQVFLVFSFLLLLVAWILSIYFFDYSEYLVPLRFSSFLGFFELGRWYRLYELTIFYTLVVFLNLFLGSVIYKKDKFLSYIILSSNIFISLIVLVLIFNFGKVVN